MNFKLFFEIFRYGIVGATATLVDISMMYVLVEYNNLHYMLAAILSFSLGALINYYMCILWVFDYRKFQNNTGIEFSFYIFISLSSLAINLLVIWGCTELLNMYYLHSKLVSILITFFYNFLSRKYLLHKSP